MMNSVILDLTLVLEELDRKNKKIAELEQRLASAQHELVIYKTAHQAEASERECDAYNLD